jgi:hypothetical protein
MTHQVHVSSLSAQAKWPYPPGYGFPSPFGRRRSLLGPSCPRCGVKPPFRRSSGLLDLRPDHNGIAAFRTSEIRSGWVLPVLRGLGVLARDGSGSRVIAGAVKLLFSTQHRRRDHRFRRPSLTKPHRKLTCVHPSDLPLARLAWMVQAPLGLHPSAVARFVTWRLQGSGTGLDTGWSVTTSHAHSSWCNIASRPPLRTARAPFRCMQLKPWQTPLAGRGPSPYGSRRSGWRWPV